MIRLVMPDMNPIVERLDESIRETIPGLRYAIKWKRAYYGVPELGWIIEMAAYAVSVNVSFFGGADFDPPPPLGTTDRSRYVKLTTWRRRRDRRCTSGSNKRGACRVGNEGPRAGDTTRPNGKGTGDVSSRDLSAWPTVRGGDGILTSGSAEIHERGAHELEPDL